MTYIPKPGDKVTSPLLVGEWIVDGINKDGTTVTVFLDGRAPWLHIQACDLTPAAPPLPPEPPVGSVVWASGRMWIAGKDYWFSIDANGDEEGDAIWSEIAADAVPVVPVTKIAEWLNDDYGYDGMAAAALGKFGWDKP